uniref:Uncharacterized protein n=2 Tax=unclassified Mycobacterium TaxID=2642494 RepID=A0A5Q5BFR0_MYCSS
MNALHSVSDSRVDSCGAVGTDGDRRDARGATEPQNLSRGARAGQDLPVSDGSHLLLTRKPPLTLLATVSAAIAEATPDPRVRRRVGPQEPLDLSEVVARLSEQRSPEITAILATFAELLAGNEHLQARCRQEVAARNDPIPEWISGLSKAEVYRVVRVARVLGDHSELVIGARLAGGKELTCVVYLDHDSWCRVGKGQFGEKSIDSVLSDCNPTANPDLSVVDMSLADVRAWIEDGLRYATIVVDAGTWPAYRPLLNWLIGLMPEGGASYQRPEWDPHDIDDLLRSFFVSAEGLVFNDWHYRYLLQELLETGTGDPLRWSMTRIRETLGDPMFFHEYIPVECVLDVPDLLRAFIPFAHARSEIRQGLTAEALAVIGEMRLGYKRTVLREAGWWDTDYEGA